jgi:hypothetical protein
MDMTKHIVVAAFSNDTVREMRIFLEMSCQEVFLAPGQKIELLAKETPELLPVTIAYLADGLQVFAHKAWDPEWMIRFEGKLIKPGYPTLLSGILVAQGNTLSRSE